MKNFKFLFLLAFICSLFSCIDEELPPLGENIYDVHGDDLIILYDVEYEILNFYQVNVRLHYSSLIKELSPAAQNSIEELQISRPGRTVRITPVSATFFDYQRSRGVNICYTMRYNLKNGESTKPSVYCIDTP